MKADNIINIGVSGAAGRMGRAVIDIAAEDQTVCVAALFESDAAATAATPMPLSRLEDADIHVLIDFTTPEATLALADICRRRGIGMVIGTTGFTATETTQLQRAGEDIPLLLAQNMSVGVNALYDIAAYAARRLRAGRLDGGYDIEVYEAHHRRKQDAPSGTALRLGRALAEASGGDLEEDGVYSRHGREGVKRGEYDIGFSVVRGGDIVGEHRVIFAGAGEQLEISHRSISRANYAAGAVRAAKFISTANAGFYDGMGSIND